MHRRFFGLFALLVLGAGTPALAGEPLSLRAEERHKKIPSVYNEHNEAVLTAVVERNAATDSFRLLDAMDILTSLPEPAPIKNLHPEAQ